MNIGRNGMFINLKKKLRYNFWVLTTFWNHNPITSLPHLRTLNMPFSKFGEHCKAQELEDENPKFVAWGSYKLQSHSKSDGEDEGRIFQQP